MFPTGSLIYSRREHTPEHRLAWEGVEGEGYTQGVGVHSMAEDRSSYSGEYRLVDREEVVVRGDQGIRVLREVPLVP